jgi:hypothetical protein
VISFSELGKMGRLGNQCFQVAATVALALRNNDKYIFPNWEYEKFFNLSGCFATSIANTHTYTEPHFHYAPVPYQPNMDIRGYFQSWRYFDDCQDIIQNLLTPKIGYGIKYNHTSIHVRRGDYVGQPQNYISLGMDYYHKAMNIIKSKYYIVVSDDIEWCKKNFSGEQFIFSEGKSPVEDLALQIACEHNIICNSSFSWWGGCLNKNPSKIVVAPNKWFGPGLPHNTQNLLPSAWIKI